MDLGKLVLASLKEAPDKIYVGEGVWAHTCLRYGSGSFGAPEHSFPDFKDGRFDAFMLEARRLYKSRLGAAAEPCAVEGQCDRAIRATYINGQKRYASPCG